MLLGEIMLIFGAVLGLMVGTRSWMHRPDPRPAYVWDAGEGAVIGAFAGLIVYVPLGVLVGLL